MLLPPISFPLRDGRTALLRSPRPQDAEDVLVHLRKVSAETEFMLRFPYEITLTPEEERDFLSSKAEALDQLMLGVWVEDRLAATLGLSPVLSCRKYAHRATVGLAVEQAFWGLGIGRKLMEQALSSAKDFGFTQVELDVDLCNQRARSLYERLGFQCCGSLPGASRRADGSFSEELHMVRFLTPKPPLPRLARFELALEDLHRRQEDTQAQLARLREEGKTKTVRYKELLAQKLYDQNILEHFRQSGLL